MSQTLTNRTVKNTIYSLIGFIWPLVLSFVAAPIIIRGLGSSRFGFYSLLNTMLSLFSLLDFGISYTFTKKLSENRENTGGRDLSEVFSSTTILYTILGLVVMLLLLLIPKTFQHLFKIPDGFISSYTTAFFILGLVFLMKMVVIPIALIPYALQRQSIPTNISLINNTLLELASIAVIKSGHGVMGLLIIQLISSAFLLVSFYIVWRVLAPNLKFIIILKKSVVKTIGQQGFWIFLSNTMGNVLAQLDKFVLGAMWGPVAVGYYSTAQMLPEKISATSFSLSHGFFPIFSEASADQSKKDRIKIIFRRSLGIISTITAALTVLVLIFGYGLIRFWVSRDFADQGAVAIELLAVTYFLLSYGSFFNSFLSGMKALKFLAISSMATAAVDVVFMFLLIPHYGINGAAFAYLLSGLPIIPILYHIERKYLESTATDIFSFYGELFAKILFVSTITYFFAKITMAPFATNLLLVMVFGALTFIIYMLFYWLFKFYNPEDISLAKTYTVGFLKNIKILIRIKN